MSVLLFMQLYLHGNNEAPISSGAKQHHTPHQQQPSDVICETKYMKMCAVLAVEQYTKNMYL
jgi:hypothetical protein